MAASAEMEKVVAPRSLSSAAESALPGQVWPPPRIRYSSTEARCGHAQASSVMSAAIRVAVTRVEQPFRLAQAAASAGMEGPLAKIPFVPNCAASPAVIRPVPSVLGKSAAAFDGVPL